MMIAQATVSSPAAPSAFFARWADMATWPEWNTDTEWVRLDGPFVPGATGVLKPKGGPKVKFVVTVLTDREFTDVSLLLGARLTFRHVVETSAGATRVSVAVTLTGPLSRLWNLVLGKDIKAGIQADLDRLAAVAEASTSGAVRSGAAGAGR
ncbi:SRPBCC family protein [Longispora sp. K20-0274]|uniref:SRPBCC family protein n=1 Tax=Longispora sp. K20-0274 TaxID=3088255 RepID=UPI003999BE87